MAVHFTTKENKRYPQALCSKSSYTSTISENFTECTCKACIKAYLGKEEKRAANRLFKNKSKKYY